MLMKPLRKLVITILFSILLWYACTHISYGQTNILPDVCSWAEWGQEYRSASIARWDDLYHGRDILDSQLDDLRVLDTSSSFWVSTADYGYFDVPEDESGIMWVVLIHTEYGRRRIYFTEAESTPATLYAYAFYTLKPFTDSNGNHYGIHPCAVFRVDKSNILDFYNDGIPRNN